MDFTFATMYVVTELVHVMWVLNDDLTFVDAGDHICGTRLIPKSFLQGIYIQPGVMRRLDCWNRVLFVLEVDLD